MIALIENIGLIIEAPVDIINKIPYYNSELYYSMITNVRI
jgi:hypothetical protein